MIGPPQELGHATPVYEGIDPTTAGGCSAMCRRTAAEGNSVAAQFERKNRGIPRASHYGSFPLKSNAGLILYALKRGLISTEPDAAARARIAHDKK